jgi:DNA end-binding protein Ku
MTRSFHAIESPFETGRFSGEPTRYHDTYQEKVRELVRAKAEGQEIAPAEEAPAATNVIDLMTVLQGSIDQARGGRTAKDEPPQKEPAPARKAARKTSGKAAQKTAAQKAQPKTARASAVSRSQRGSGSGTSDLRQLSKAELYERATEQDITGRSRMSREELIDALARAGRRRKKSAA